MQKTKGRGHTSQDGTEGGRITDNTETKGRGYTKQEGTEGGGSPTIERRREEVKQTKKAHTGEGL